MPRDGNGDDEVTINAVVHAMELEMHQVRVVCNNNHCATVFESHLLKRSSAETDKHLRMGIIHHRAPHVAASHARWPS